jgi:hypothetical protein
VALIKGVVKLEVVAATVVDSAAPPVEAAYHRNVPVTPVDALRRTVPAVHAPPLVGVMVAADPIVAITAARGVVGPQAGDAVVKLT